MLQQQTWKHFAKNKRHNRDHTSRSHKQWRSLPRVYRALGQTQFRCSQPARSWQHEI